MKDMVSWGIVGAGAIAGEFAQVAINIEGVDLAGIGSRSISKAKEFADRFQVRKAYGSYTELIRNSEIDALYVALPHSDHYEWVRKGLESGKHILCEKAFTVNSFQAHELIQLAAANRLFLMEALPTQFLPAFDIVRRLIADDVIGKVRMTKADICFDGGQNENGRLLNPLLAGGTLLDVGVYVINFLEMAMGLDYTEVVSQAFIGSTKVDEQFSAILKYGSGGLGIITAAIRIKGQKEGRIFGTKGSIFVPDFQDPSEIILETADGITHIDAGRVQHRFFYEISEAVDCIRSGKLQSDIMTHKKTLQIMELMDKMREDWNFRYPEQIEKL